jgi:hypothetical protein
MFSHGQKRVKGKKEISEKEREINQKAEKVCQEFLEIRKTYHSSSKSLKELLEYSAGVLDLMSDQPTVINFRQELINKQFEVFLTKMKELVQEKTKEEVLSEMSSVKDFIKSEIKFNTKLVMQDLKSYQLWFYRLWLLKKYAVFERDFMINNKDFLEYDEKTFSEAESFKFICKDLKMCEMFLMKDERNFHTWNFRFNLWNALIAIYPKFTKKMLLSEKEFLDQIHNKNYSNYSTIHFKMKIYEILETLNEDLHDVYADQLQKVYEGLYISPNEQALYLFQRWLFDRLLPKVILTVQVINSNSKIILF